MYEHVAIPYSLSELLHCRQHMTLKIISLSLHQTLTVLPRHGLVDSHVHQIIHSLELT